MYTKQLMRNILGVLPCGVAHPTLTILIAKVWFNVQAILCINKICDIVYEQTVGVGSQQPVVVLQHVTIQ